MKIKVYTMINEAKSKKFVAGFEVLALEPGNLGRLKKEKRHWKEKEEDKSLLKITHLMERAMSLDHLTIYKQSDRVSAKLLEYFTKKTTLNAEMSIMLSKEVGNYWQAKYGFNFKIEKFRHNEPAKSGIYVGYVVLKIKDKSETLVLKDDKE